MRRGRSESYVDRSEYIGFRCSEELAGMVRGLAKKSNKKISELLNDWAVDGAHKFDRELRQKQQERLSVA